MKLVTTRRVLILTLLTIVGMGSYVVYFTQVVNPRVMHELQAEPDGERAQRVLRLTLPNGKTLPINYLREGETVYLGADFGWWKAIDASGTPVELLLRGQVRRGMARVVLDDPQSYANGYLFKGEHPDWGEKVFVGSPIVMSDTPTRSSMVPPELGQDTEMTLVEIGGFDWDEVEQLRADGAF